MFSNNSVKQAEACRFCWMCRHICPVSNSCGDESWTPRVKGLLMSMIERGTPYDSDIADTMYHCTFCDACAHDCATGYKPSEFIREARTVAIVENLAPAKILNLIDTINDNGNIFGTRNENLIFAAAGNLTEDAEILLYIGQTAAAVCTDVAISAIRLLKKAGVKFTMLRNEPASGAYLSELMGYTGDVQAVAAAADKAIRSTGVKKVVVLNPADAYMFREQYPQWNLLSDIEILTISSYLSDLIADGKLKINACQLRASLQEPVKLTRGLDEESPLKNLCAALDVELVEMFLHGKMSRCVGTVPFEQYDPHVVKNMVAVRVEDAQRLDSNKILTASPDDYYVMSKYAPETAEIVDIFSLLDRMS